MAQHDIGDAVNVYVLFKDTAGAAADPSAVTLTVKDPSGNVATVSNAQITADDYTEATAALGETVAAVTGCYKGTIDIDEAGWWHYKWAGTGAVAEVERGWLGVRRDRVGDPA